MLFLFGAAVGAVASAFVTHAFGEGDRQSAKHHKQIAEELRLKYDALKLRNEKYSNVGNKTISDLNRKLALSEVEKDCLHLALSLYHSLIDLMWDIDKEPTLKALFKYESAVKATNIVLSELKQNVIQVPNDYYSRNLMRIRSCEKSITPESEAEMEPFGIKFRLSDLPPTTKPMPAPEPMTQAAPCCKPALLSEPAPLSKLPAAPKLLSEPAPLNKLPLGSTLLSEPSPLPKLPPTPIAKRQRRRLTENCPS